MAKRDIPRIQTQLRDRLGTRYARRLREKGQLPAVVYGHGQEPVHVSAEAGAIHDVLHHGAHLLEIVVNDQPEPVLVKAVQWDHLGKHVVHVDLTRVDLTEDVEVEVDLQLIGEPKALEAEGAILDHPVTTITVRCRADVIPDKLTHDISELGLDDVLTVSQLVLPEGVALGEDMEGDTIVAQIQIMAEQEEEEAPVEGEQPEVIGRAATEEAEAEE